MATNDQVQFTIIDDGGLLALVDAEAYTSFVAPDWTYERLLDHFRVEMAKKTILVWECGDGGEDYRIAVRNGFTATEGFRTATGAIKVERGALNLASYSALTMAAQFEDEIIPSKHEISATFATPSKSMQVRIVQTYAPDEYLAEPQPHFIIELEPGDAPSWSHVQWETALKAAASGRQHPLSAPSKRAALWKRLFRGR